MRVRDRLAGERREVGLEFPPIELVAAVEHLINEPVWTKRYYDDEGRLIES